MLRYESLFITVPEITSDESQTLEKNLGKAVTDAKGSIISFERWGKYQLAYPIRKNEYGVYYLMRFEVTDAQRDTVLNELKKNFGVKLADLIMRNVIVRLHPQRSLEYKRPESLEEAPSKDIDTIMKESKTILRRDRGGYPTDHSMSKGAPASMEPELDIDLAEDEETLA